MRKIILIPLLLILAASLVHAQQNVTAGISPDNPFLWRMEVFFEHVSTAITYDSAEKINKRMHSAEERAAEMEKMLRFKKTEAAQSAKNAFDDEVTALQQYISEFEYKSPQNELDAEYKVQELLQNYNSEITSLTTTLASAQLDDNQTQIVQEFVEKVKAADFQSVLNAKKDATILKLKANGLTNEDIAALQTGIVEKVKTFADNLLNETFSNQTVSNQTNNSEQVQENVSEESVSEQPQSVVTDVSSKSKVKIDGIVTAEQQQAVNLLYSQLIAENTEAEVEITVTQMDNGLWKIEKEIDGTLTSLQDKQLDALLVSLGNSPSSLHITVKYDSSEADAYVGESNNISTSFSIG